MFKFDLRSLIIILVLLLTSISTQGYQLNCDNLESIWVGQLQDSNDATINYLAQITTWSQQGKIRPVTVSLNYGIDHQLFHDQLKGQCYLDNQGRVMAQLSSAHRQGALKIQLQNKHKLKVLMFSQSSPGIFGYSVHVRNAAGTLVSN
jgi:hypothetical protein